MKIYYCKRMRMLEFLLKRGFKPIGTLPDIRNPEYVVWAFEWDEAFDKVMNEYFSTHTLSASK